jgi:hypothetical protein
MRTWMGTLIGILMRILMRRVNRSRRLASSHWWTDGIGISDAIPRRWVLIFELKWVNG